MQIELRVCQHCVDGEHGSEEKTAIVSDMVACAERIDEYKEVIDLDAVHINRVTDDDPGTPEALPVVAASIADDQVVLNDTQLATEGMDGTMLIYIHPRDILTVLVRNLEEISKATGTDVSVDLSQPGSELVSPRGEA